MHPSLPLFAQPAAQQAHLRILATTDLHVHILPYDYYADQAVGSPGLLPAAGLIGRMRAGARNSLLLDNGDFLQGNPLGDYLAESPSTPDDLPHPMIAAMNALGYDAATLGNHEFNYGLDFLIRSLGAAAFPVVSANVVTHAGPTPDADDTLLPPFVLLDRLIADAEDRMHPLRIGLIGLLPPQIMVWDRTHLAGHVTTRDIVDTARARIPQMQRAGADLIVVLCHSGIGSTRAEAGMENAATALAALPGIDALITGHSHLVFPGPGFAGLASVDALHGRLAGKPAVMAGSFGSHLGVIDLLLDRSTGRWRMAGASVQAIPVGPGDTPETLDQAAIRSAAEPAHAATLAHIRRPVGHSAVPLNSFFAQLPGNAALALVARAQAWHVAQVLQGTDHADLPLLSAAAPFKMGGRGGPDYYTDVPAGNLALRHVADLYIYPNMIRAVRITGSDLRAWLDRASDVFRTLILGRHDQPLMDPDMPSSHFDVIHGITWTIDLSRIPGDAGRIRDLCHQGRPIRAEDRFVVATNSYRAAGGADFPGAGGDTVILEGREATRDILRRYILATGTITGTPAPTFRFHPLPGTSALFETSPRATPHLGSLHDLHVEPAGPADAGFARFRLHL